MQLADSVALVTGGASGLGEATVRLLAGAGGRGMILDRPGSAGEALVAELGGAVGFSPADVTDESQVGAAATRTVERFGAVHVAVNCAGVGVAMRTIAREGPHPLDLS